jgi:hypothetical protein
MEDVMKEHPLKGSINLGRNSFKDDNWVLSFEDMDVARLVNHISGFLAVIPIRGGTFNARVRENLQFLLGAGNYEPYEKDFILAAIKAIDDEKLAE